MSHRKIICEDFPKGGGGGGGGLTVRCERARKLLPCVRNMAFSVHLFIAARFLYSGS